MPSLNKVAARGTGADLIAAMQFSPRGDLEIDLPRHNVPVA
jgi:hypothetical protein